MQRENPAQSVSPHRSPDRSRDWRFSWVGPETPIERLRLDWREKDLPERVRTKHVHRLHPALGKFIPQIAEIFLRKYRPATVLDPFCGSGTTLVEAKCLGIPAAGYDLSPFSVLLARVKTGTYDLPKLRSEMEATLAGAKERLGRPLLRRRLSDRAGSYLRKWLAPAALEELLAYREAIGRARYGDLLRVILARSARSARLTTHFNLEFPKAPQRGPYYCYKHRRTCRPTESAWRFLERYSRDTFERVSEFASVAAPSPVRVCCADARRARFPDADLVVTSPPYVGLIDYHEQHHTAFDLLGLPERRDAEIGRAGRGAGRGAVEAYLDDMTRVFRRVIRAVTPGGRIIVIVHDRRRIFGEIASRLGVETEHLIRRQVNRRTGMRAGEFYEDVIVWRRR